MAGVQEIVINDINTMMMKMRMRVNTWRKMMMIMKMMMMMTDDKFDLNESVDGLVGVIGLRRRCRSATSLAWTA